MRRTRVTVSAAVLSAAVLAGSVLGPVSSARAEGDPISQVTCGTVGPPLCDVVEQVTALLAPLQPVLDLAGPALGDLGSSANALTALLESSPELPLRDVADAAGAVLTELNKLTGPLLGLLDGAGLDVGLIESALGQLQALALDAMDQVAPAPAAPAPSAPANRTKAASANGPASFSTPSGTNDAGTVSGAPGSVPGTARDLPDVPAGSTLSLAPLGLPDFSFDASTAPSGVEMADGLVDDVVEQLVQPAGAIVDADGTGGKATVAVIAFTTLMLAAGLLLDQQRKARLLLPLPTKR